MKIVEVHSGNSPIVLGLPHTGTYVPDDIFEQLTPLGKELNDTDWYIHQLYEDLLPNLTTVRAKFHRYVIDANRNPSGTSLYPGQNTTALVPLTDFDGIPLWEQKPTLQDVEKRRSKYHVEYHAALLHELHRIREIHGVAILYDCHSIRSNIPYLFEGILPDFNIGTNKGRTCSSLIEECVLEVCTAADEYSTVLNGRFKGGWTTRHYGRPLDGIHSIQMELAQSTYLESEKTPFGYDNAKADNLRVHLQDILTSLAKLAPSLARLK